MPSTGSMIHVGLSVKMQGFPFATDSSPMKLPGEQTGNRFEKIHFMGSSLEADSLSHQCVPSPNSCTSAPMMIFSTLSSVFVTRSTVELLVETFISLSPASLMTCRCSVIRMQGRNGEKHGWMEGRSLLQVPLLPSGPL